MKATLHILNKPADHPRIRHCLDAIRSGDSLLLIESAVALCLHNEWLETLPAEVEIHALEPDVQGRGLTQYIKNPIQLIDFAGFVGITEQLERVIHW
ncbi:sulfurtransferase complex subunit TusB [Marinobacteraceae bacterium S3BR75-40.1]